MKQYAYSVCYGTVPYGRKIFTKYSEASKFIREQLDKGFTVHSIHKEWVESRDDSDESIVDIGEL